MIRTVKFEANLLRDEWFMDIDERNSVVDETIDDYPWANIDKTATDIEYEIITSTVTKEGDAVIRARFNYE